MRKASHPKPVVLVPQIRNTESTIDSPVPPDQRNINISKVVPKIRHSTGQDQNLVTKKYERWKQQKRRPECSNGHPPELQPLPVETKPPSVVRD